MVRIVTLLAAAAASFAWNATAEEIRELSVSRDGPVFTTRAEFVIDAPQAAVSRAFTQFDNLAAINPTILDSRSETTADGRLRVTTRLRDCVVFFCRAIALVEYVSLAGEDELQTQIIADSSDFESGQAHWQFIAVGSQTRVLYKSSIEPKFWVPPLLGQRALRNTLRRHIRAAAGRLEPDA